MCGRVVHSSLRSLRVCFTRFIDRDIRRRRRKQLRRNWESGLRPEVSRSLQLPSRRGCRECKRTLQAKGMLLGQHLCAQLLLSGRVWIFCELGCHNPPWVYRNSETKVQAAVPVRRGRRYPSHGRHVWNRYPGSCQGKSPGYWWQWYLISAHRCEPLPLVPHVSFTPNQVIYHALQSVCTPPTRMYRSPPTLIPTVL